MRALLASPCSRVSARRFRVAPHRRLAPARALPETDRVGVVPEYGDPTFDAAVREAFDSGRECVADAEQARTLWDHGWDVLDVRDAHEIEFHGNFPNPPVGTIGGVFETIVAGLCDLHAALRASCRSQPVSQARRSASESGPR